ncbi:MAG: class I mannose-6-phosphate isomerase [Bryobacteraceae bacterium]
MTVPARLAATPHDKVWGSPYTEPWYRNSERRNIGEVWFRASDEVPLLVKFLFTTGKLSVQVHPDDDYARRHERSRGKTEMWHILRAQPGAQVALAPREPITPERLREAALTGEIEHLLRWIPAHAGDTFFIPAGTIHALGAGLILCEVQQLSDVTYRLYDYGRQPGAELRELHLDHGLAVARCEPFDGRVNAMPLGNGRELLAQCQYFRTERLVVEGSVECPAPAKNTLCIALEGEGEIAGQPFRAGEGFELAAGRKPVRISSPAATFLITSEP